MTVEYINTFDNLIQRTESEMVAFKKEKNNFSAKPVYTRPWCI